MNASEPNIKANSRKHPNRNAVKPGSRRRNGLLLAAMLTPALAIGLPATAIAESGALFLNLKFSTSSSSTPPAFGINFKQHETVEEQWWMDHPQKSRNFQGINLFSTNPSTPGLMNQAVLDWRTLTSNDTSESEDGSVAETAMRLLLAVGVIGASVAQISSDLDDGCSGTEVLLTILGNGDAEWCHDE